MEINKENFDKEIKTDGIVIVDFFATWCGPCQMLSPILEELSTTYKVCKVNVDENQELSREYGIMSIPTVFIYKDGKQINKFIGYKTKEEIEKLLKEE